MRRIKKCCNDYCIVPVEDIDQFRCLKQDYLNSLTYQQGQ